MQRNARQIRHKHRKAHGKKPSVRHAANGKSRNSGPRSGSRA